MGLDLVELVLETEQTFAISIPDRDARHLRTVGDLQDYVVAAVAVKHPRRPPDAPSDCTSMALFHRVRGALVEIFELPRWRVTPDAHLADLLPADDRRFCWDRLADALDLRLPRAGCGRFGGDVIPRECTAVRDVVRTAIARNYGTLVIAAGGWIERGLREVVLDV
ncbi:MAG TPA: hypothetical protein VKA84_07145, partial [Gemmatimonadaceae bacterium]|nr:hypothetical protein [Gemmatimonadaceae bacterium]